MHLAKAVSDTTTPTNQVSLQSETNALQRVSDLGSKLRFKEAAIAIMPTALHGHDGEPGTVLISGSMERVQVKLVGMGQGAACQMHVTVNSPWWLTAARQ